MTSTLWNPTKGYDFVSPAFASTRAKRGMELVDLRQLGILLGVAGGAPKHGTHVTADIITQLADGTNLNDVWADYMDLLNVQNASRQALINFLTFNVTNPTEAVAQPGDGVDFEESTEQGEPSGSRVEPVYFQLGYTFKWYDLAARYTWQYLADATQQMVDSVANAAVEAYNRLLMVKMMQAVFNPVNAVATIRGNAYNVYRFYNNDGTVPPAYKTNTFLGSHTHYLSSGAATVTFGDLDEIANDFDAHGYGQLQGYQRVLMVNKVEGDVIRQFRSVANGGTATYDFLAASNQPGAIITQNTVILGQGPPAGTLNGLTVIGSYGSLLIVQDDWMPPNYVFAFVTGGENNLGNPIGIREHANAGLRGMRLVKGRNPDYPLIDSFWSAGFGFGVRQRGAGIAMRISASAYVVPPMYA